MKQLILLLITVSFTIPAFSTSTYHSCTDETGLFTYLPDDQELIYNTNEVYDKSSYNIHFGELISAEKGSCVAEDDKSYDYESVTYTLEVSYLKDAMGAKSLRCQKGFDALPAGLTCKE